MMLTKKRKAWATKRTAAPTFKGHRLANNVGVSTRYAERLSALVTQMTEQVTREVLRMYRTESGFAQDATIASQSRILLSTLQSKFNALFARNAKRLAESMAEGASKASTTSLHSSLERLSGGLSLKTSAMPPQVVEIYKAAVAENVALIKSISTDYLNQVQGSVMRSITSGRGLEDLVPALQKYEGVTHRRARNIALDQTRKTYNQINRGRMQALGVKSFMWHHSGGGAHPREDHVEMDGKVYRFDDPPVIDERTGERGIPGQAVNCKCTMSPVFDFSEAS
jgi:SPP1 gp7 family putative phage head morphogenesis protein